MCVPVCIGYMGTLANVFVSVSVREWSGMLVGSSETVVICEQKIEDVLFKISTCPDKDSTV